MQKKEKTGGISFSLAESMRNNSVRVTDFDKKRSNKKFDFFEGKLIENNS